MTYFNWRGKDVMNDVNKATSRALSDGAEHILEESNRTAPKDEGILIQTSGTDVDERKKESSVYYTAPYAPYLHEHPEFNFKNGREGKWLEKTVNERGKAVRDYMENEIKKAMKG